MNNTNFFDEVAFRWDEMCNHDSIKIRKIINLASIKEGAKILDVGTGTGILVSYLLEKSPDKVIGIDLSKNMIKVAKEKYKDTRVQFLCEDIMNFSEKDFDYIFIYSAYPHFEDKEKLFKHLNDRLSLNGKIIIAHSESREKINNLHSKKEEVKDDVLSSAKDTASIMGKYFKVLKTIDNDEMYYVLGLKEQNI